VGQNPASEARLGFEDDVGQHRQAGPATAAAGANLGLDLHGGLLLLSLWLRENDVGQRPARPAAIAAGANLGLDLHGSTPVWRT
jgi:hypothetical protein